MGSTTEKDCLIVVDGVFILVLCETVHVLLVPVKLPLALAS